jgi:hypothetical protein
MPQTEWAPSIEDEEEEIRLTRCERAALAKQAHRDKIQKLYSKNIKKWSEKEYAKLRQSNAYAKPRSDRCSAEFWNPTKHKISDDLYAEKTYRVSPMHSINFSHMDKHASYFAEAGEICEEFGLTLLMNFTDHYNGDIIAQFFATVYVWNQRCQSHDLDDGWETTLWNLGSVCSPFVPSGAPSQHY